MMMEGFIFKINDNQVTDMIDVIKTESWENWDYVMVDSLVLNSSDENFIFHVDRGTFNLGFFEFERLGDISMVETKYVGSYTDDENKIIINTNKNLNTSVNLVISDFKVYIDDVEITINDISFSDSPRSLVIELDKNIQPTDIITVSYDGNAIKSTDNEFLSYFYA